MWRLWDHWIRSVKRVICHLCEWGFLVLYKTFSEIQKWMLFSKSIQLKDLKACAPSVWMHMILLVLMAWLSMAAILFNKFSSFFVQKCMWIYFFLCNFWLLWRTVAVMTHSHCECCFCLVSGKWSVLPRNWHMSYFSIFIWIWVNT